MNIRKKLAVSSILMILLPIAVSSALSLMLLFAQGDNALNHLRVMYEDDNGLLNVQTILYHYKEKALSYEPLNREEYPRDGQGISGSGSGDWDESAGGMDFWEDGDDWDDDDWDDWIEDYEEEQKERQEAAFSGLIRELSSLGYSHQISCGGQVVMSNLPDETDAKIEELTGTQYKSLENFSVSAKGFSAIKRTYKDGEKEVAILACCDSYVGSTGIKSQAIREILALAGVFVGIFLATMAASVIIFTKWLSAGLNDPIAQLSEAVRQVEEGNYGYRIGSRRKDELGKACNEFDEMSGYLERTLKERERYEEARKQLLAGISHDLRTPLTSIKAYVEGLRDGIANTEEKKKRYYDALAIRTVDLEALIDNLSLFSRFDRGEYHYTMEIMELRQFLKDFFYENELELKKNHVKTEYTAWPRMPVFIKGDRSQLRRVLGNLIDNAIKYRGKEKTKLLIGLWRYKNKICLEISDDGPGVPKQEREKIFDAFYRGDRARQNPGKGSGLGLAIVKGILEDHGASIQAMEAEEGGGLKLMIQFPEGRRAGGRMMAKIESGKKAAGGNGL